MFKTVDRYVLKHIATPLIATLSLGLLMLLAQRMVELLDETLGKKSSFGVVFELLAYLIPFYMATALPAALYMGVLLGFNKMSKNSELDAMFASGIGLPRLMRPALVLSLIFALFSVFTYGWLQPLTRYAYRALVFDVASVDAFFLAEEGVFMQAGKRTFILDKLNRSGGSFERIFIFDYNGSKGSETITSSRGKLIATEGQTRPILHLENGHRLGLERWPAFEASIDGPPSQSASFETTQTPLGKVVRDAFRPRGNDERELTLTELYQRLDNPPPGASKASMWSEFNYRLVHILVMFLLPFVAAPFALGRIRSPRAYKIATALILIVAFHQIIEQGMVAAKLGAVSPLLSMWLPLAVLLAFAVWNFWRLSEQVQGEGLDRWLTPLHEFFVKPFQKRRVGRAR